MIRDLGDFLVRNSKKGWALEPPNPRGGGTPIPVRVE